MKNSSVEYLDVVYRIYESGRKSLCIYLDEHIFHIGETFKVDGGLEQFSTYGNGIHSYKYQYKKVKSYSVIEKTIKLLETFKNSIEYFDSFENRTIKKEIESGYIDNLKLLLRKQKLDQIYKK